MDESITSCDVCQSVAAAIDAYYHLIEENTNNDLLQHRQERDAYKKIVLGSFEDLESKQTCTSCQDIVSKFIKDDIQPPAQGRMVFEIHEWGIWIGENTEDDSVWEGDVLFLLPLRDSMLGCDVGRMCDAQKVDMNLLRQWISCCEMSHTDQCLRSTLPAPPHRIYLIDIEQGCLVLQDPGYQYIALSYVWGNAVTIKTTKSNLDYMKRPGSIRADCGNLVIPNTIRDALRLCLQVGIKYLWVDTFCIVQDDEDTKQLHLNSMASIYANANFTIIAADGENANHGLRGIEGSAQSRNVTIDVVRFQNHKNMIIYHNKTWRPENSNWESRGWTFQEAVFSRRVLVFNGLISWTCRSASWEEHIHKPTENPAFKTKPKRLGRADFIAAQEITWPDIETWNEYVVRFNDRKLTYEKDVIDAFSGITSVFSSKFSGGILWGMPEIFFDYCIIWQPTGILRRRQVRGTSFLENDLPSWSWVGWEGEISFGTPIPSDDDPDYDDRAVEIIPTVQWRNSINPTSNSSSVKTIDYPSWAKYRWGESEKLPIGWHRELYPDDTPYYTHETIPLVRFRYPIPLENTDASKPTANRGRYLRFKTQRTWLSVGQRIAEQPVEWTSSAACLVDSNGDWAGSVRLSISQSDELPKGESCELIALSSGVAQNSGDYFGKLDEWLVPERPCESPLYEFYYVMWIERESGIAYRKAIGTVYKNVWESQRLEEVDIVLG